MSEQWSDLLMNDHQTTEKVFEAVERALAGPGEPSAAGCSVTRRATSRSTWTAATTRRKRTTCSR